MQLQQEIAFEKAESFIGKELTCLVDEPYEDGEAEGRWFGQAPHVDSICRITGCSANQGEFIRGIVTGREDYDLVVKQIED